MKRKIFGLSLIFCLAIVLCFASVFSVRNVAKAENVDVLVSLTNDSLLTAYDDYFAYTNSKGIYLAKDNKLLSYEEKNDFDCFLDIAMNSTHILALAQKGDQKYLWAYEYNDMRIAKINFTLYDLHVEYLVGIYANEDGFYALETNKLIHISIDPPQVISQYFNSNTDWTLNPAYVDIQDYAVLDNILYCILDGDFYAIDEQNFHYPDLSKFLKRSGEYIGISVAGSRILLLSASGVYEYNNIDSSLSTLTVDGLNGNSQICWAYDSQNDVRYVYIKSNINSVNMYVYTEGNLEYYGCFDNTVYTHPTEFDIVKLYKTNANVTLYSSPRHLQRMGIIPQSRYFIALSEKDDFIYVYYHDANEDRQKKKACLVRLPNLCTKTLLFINIHLKERAAKSCLTLRYLCNSLSLTTSDRTATLLGAGIKWAMSIATARRSTDTSKRKTFRRIHNSLLRLFQSR